MKIIRLISVCLAAILCLSSCGIIIINDIDGKKTETTAGTETDPATETDDTKEIVIDKETSDEIKAEANAALEALDTIKLLGMRLLIASVDDTFYGGDGTATLLTSDRIERANKTAEKLDGDLHVVTYSEEELYQKLSEAVSRGEYFADILAVPQRLVGKLASDGLIKSLRTIAGFDLKADYFCTDATQAFSAGHALYALAGEGSFEPEKLYCVYFNRELAKSLGYDMYSLVSDGDWTLEKYAECAAAATGAEKKSALLPLGQNYKRMLLLGSGFDFTTNATDKTPAANTFSDEYRALVELLASVENVLPAQGARDAFLSGESLFYIDTVSSAAVMADSELVWGMLPFPKYKKEAEYKTYTSPNAVVFCIPVGAADEKSSGDFIEAICAASKGYIKYDYIYYNMLNVLRDNGSVNSLNIIINSPNYDFVTAAQTGYPTLYANTAEAFDELVSGALSFDEYKEKETEVAQYLAKWFPVTNK